MARKIVTLPVKPNAEAPPRAGYVIAAVDRALALLQAMAERPNSGVTALARATGGTKSQVFRLLHTLERRGFVRRDPKTATYTLGLSALVLGDRAHRQTDLARLARPHLDALAAETRENVYLTVREGLEAVCIDMRQSPQPLRLYAEVGRGAPLHVGGGPKVLLAFAPQAIVDKVMASPLKAFTPATDATPAALQKSLDKIRRTGLNESRGDLDAGAFSFAAPVRDHSGAVLAAISVAGPIARLSPALAARYRETVRSHAARLSHELGWTEGEAGAPHLAAGAKR